MTKITLATSIFPPDIGGPAIYSQKMKDGLERIGHEVGVVSYRGLRACPQPLKIFIYFLSLFKNTINADFIYSFNLISCGLPAYFCAKILRKRLFLRIGGDFLWERAVESGRTKKPLREYYEIPKTFTEKLFMALMKTVFNRADKVIFTSIFQRDIYLKFFKIKKEKITIIQNPFPEMEVAINQPSANNYQLLFAGRLIKLKNIDFLIKVFYKVLQKTEKDLTLKIIGDGPERKNLKADERVVFSGAIAQMNLLREIQQSYICVLPSLSEITPNFALECIRLGKPILLTKETGYYEIFKDDLIFIDPQNEKDLEEKIIHLLDERNYLNYIESIKKIPTDWSWDNVIEEHEKSFIHWTY